VTSESSGDKRARLPAAARACVAALAAAGLVWCAWATLRAGASRVLSDYAVRAREPAAAYSASLLTPADPEAHYALAGTLADSGDPAGAARAYTAAAALRPRDYVIRLELGKVKDEAGDTEGALAEFREAARLAPFYAQPRWQLGNALLRAGARDEAVENLRRAAGSNPALYPNFLQALWYAGGRDARALAADARPRTPEETTTTVRFLIRNGAAGEGVRLLRESTAAPSEESKRALLKDLLAAGDYADAYDIWSGGRGGGRGAVTDGGFEAEARTDDEGFGWHFAQGSTGVRLSLDADSPRQGARSLRVEFNGGSEPSAASVSQLVLVEPGARYRLSFSARTKELVTGGLPFVQVSSAAKGEALASSPALAPGTSDWRDYSVEFTTPSAVEAVLIALKRQPCTSSPCPAFGGVWLDAFELKKL
jgi:hypothetical protein